MDFVNQNLFLKINNMKKVIVNLIICINSVISFAQPPSFVVNEIYSKKDFIFRGVQWVDLDNDNDQDILVIGDNYESGRIYDDSIFFFENDGNNQFTKSSMNIPYLFYYYGTDQDYITIGDYNGDQLMDFAFLTQESPRRFKIYLNKGGNHFDSIFNDTADFEKTFAQNYDPTKVDVITGNFRGSNSKDEIVLLYSHKLYLFDVQGNQMLDTLISDASQGNKGLIQTVNYNNDSISDIITFGGGNVKIIDPAANFSVALLDSFANRPAHAADIENDGDLDYVLKSSAGGVQLQLNNNNSFTVSSIPNTFSLANVYLNDINSDGFKDLIWSKINRVEIRLNDGNNQFPPTNNSFGINLDKPSQFSCSDANMDGWKDILIASDTMITMLTYNGFVSVEELENEKQLLIYPNPFIDEFTIQSNLEIEKIQIFDTKGQLVQHEASENKIKIKDETKQVFVIKVFDKDGTISTKRIIKN